MNIISHQRPDDEERNLFLPGGDFYLACHKNRMPVSARTMPKWIHYKYYKDEAERDPCCCHGNSGWEVSFLHHMFIRHRILPNIYRLCC